MTTRPDRDVLNGAAPAKSGAGVLQFGRFIIVGSSNFLVSLTIYYLVYNHLRISNLLWSQASGVGKLAADALSRLGIGSIDGGFANACGFMAGVLNSFIWNRKWTFGASGGPRRQFVRFLVINLLCLGGSTLGIVLLVDVARWPYLPCWFLVGGLVMLVNFFAYKYWAFDNGGR